MFQGFSQETVDFMWGIRFNNERTWFEAHKDIYLTQFYRPMQALGAEIYDFIREERPDYDLIHKVTRIYRDARRLHGQGPYKDHLWLTIRPENDIWSRQPVFWFEITPEEWSYGVGFWNADAQTLAAMRRDMDQDPKRAEKLVRRLSKDGRFAVQGKDYARKKGESTPLLAEWYNKKDLSVGRYCPADEALFSPGLADTLADGYSFLEPVYRYFKSFCKAGLEDLK